MQKKYSKSLFSKGIAILMTCFIVFQTFGTAPALALSSLAELTKIEAWVTPINGTKNMVYSTASPTDAVTINQAIDQDSTFSIRFDFNAPSDLSGDLNDLILPLPYEFAAEELIRKMQLENKPHYTAPNGYFTYTYHVDTARQRKYIQVRFDKDVLEKYIIKGLLQNGTPKGSTIKGLYHKSWSERIFIRKLQLLTKSHNKTE